MEHEHLPSVNQQPSSSDSMENEEPTAVIEQDIEKRFYFDIYEVPPVHMTFFFAMQQVLMSLSRSLSTSLLVTEIVCARSEENFKARLLSTTMLISGICTLLQTTIGIRLPLYQGPAATYVIPLVALATLPQWNCDTVYHSNINQTANISVSEEPTGQEDYIEKVQRLEGSLMIAGAAHLLIGSTGLVGVLLRFIGPITVIPALTMVALYSYRASVKFAKTQWGVSLFTIAIAIVLSFYLRHKQTPLPSWSRNRGFRVKFYPLHKMFAILIACIFGWLLCALLTFTDVLSNDPKSDAFYARTDSRLHVVRETDWFIFPYPGQFGTPSYDTGALITFIMGTISSIIDSIGDYYACAKVCNVPPPPKHAVNRGIAVEGLLSLLGGWAGAGHATSTFGGNIGAIGITQVASLRVFQAVGVIFIVFGLVGKIGAVFITIPYCVVGGMMTINFGVLAGIMLSNLQFIDISSTRNLAIIGISMLMAFMFPHWLQSTPDAINTGNTTLDGIITMILANPAFMAGLLACLMDNTIPGTGNERGMTLWQAEYSIGDTLAADDIPNTEEKKRNKKIKAYIYIIPYLEKVREKIPFLHLIPCCPNTPAAKSEWV